MNLANRTIDDSSPGMINRAFWVLIQEEVRRRLPAAPDSATKEELFLTLFEQQGAEALFDVGYSLLSMPQDPIVKVLTAGESPRDVLRTWRRLERFSHSAHRTREHNDEGSESHLILEHFSTTGSAIHDAHHHFVWGIISALLERAGFDVTLTVRPKDATFADVHVRSGTRREHEPIATTGGTRQAMAQVFERDTSRSWRVGEVAKTLGLSPRALQRLLQQEGSSFSERLRELRWEAAKRLLREGKLNLTEVAFCVGFSDLAHLSRSARDYFKISATELQKLLA